MDITNKIIISFGIYILFFIILVIAIKFAGWVVDSQKTKKSWNF